MIYINREIEPLFWIAFRKKNPQVRYNELQETEERKEIRNQLRKFMIQQQHGLCAYCCCTITPERSLTEHIKPEDGYPQFSMDYSNIVVCCSVNKTEATCGASKKNRYDGSLFVSPLQEDCETHFAYYPNGEVVSTSPKGDYTIKLLNLNSYRLRVARKAQVEACRSYHDSEMVKSIYLEPDCEDRLQPYADIVKYLFHNGFF